MKLTVVIPCYNEIATIRAIVDAVRAAPYPDKQIIIVDACSTDGTVEVLKGDTECLDDYEAFEAAVISDYNAETAVERQLVLRLANVLWRLRRATSIETAIFNSTIEDTRLLVCTSSLWTRRRAPDHCVSYYRGCTGRFPADSTNLPSAHLPERIFDPSAAYVAPCPFRFPFLN